MLRKIYLSAGHQVKNNKGNGAISVFGDEAKLTQMLRNRIEEISIYHYREYSMYVDDEYMTLNDVINVINKLNNFDLALELHLNSVSDSSAAGTLCIIYNKKCTEARKYANAICKITADALGTENLGSRTMGSLGRNLAFLRRTTCPAVILEVCFLSNESDMKKFWINWETLCQKLCDYFGTL